MQHNRVPLICLVLLALMTSAFLATQLSSGQASQTDRPPLKMKLVRDKAHLKNAPGPAEIAAFMKTLPQEEERQLEDSIPKHIPIKIRIKKEKEAGFKDLKNERWAREFELEVTNTGTKPIYSLDLYVTTDVTSAKGSRVVFPLYYGRDELGDIRTKAEPTDVPINPGESVSLKIYPSQLNAWDYARTHENRPLPKHLKVEFQFLNFGDGTGYVGTGGTPLPSATPGLGGLAYLPSLTTHTLEWKDAPPGSALSKLMAFNLPTALWPVNFFCGSEFDTNSSSPPVVQTCCEGANCSRSTRSRDRTCVNCQPQTRVGTALCSDPAGACLINKVWRL